jgi:ABC-type uncharacterized transport system ATPase subunit
VAAIVVGGLNPTGKPDFAGTPCFLALTSMSGSTIQIRELTKRYGAELTVDRLSFEVAPGHVTGFLGPNGAGKSTTMCMILGLDRPTTGSASRRYSPSPA